MKKGLFIALEGIEGTGKTTQAKLLTEFLRHQGYDSILTEEPGGTLIGSRVRDILLSVQHTDMDPVTELLLYFADRAQHLRELIQPALEASKIVVTDRFTDSTLAYQGYGRGIDINFILEIDRISTSCMRPDITFLLDLDVEEGLRRNRGINKQDRLELEDIAFHKRVRAGYHELATREPERIKLIEATEDIGDIQRKIQKIITDLLHTWH